MKVYKKMIGEVKAHYVKKNQINSVKVTSSEHIYKWIKDSWPTEIELYEAFVCVFLSRANNTIGYSTIGIGGMAGTVADGKKVFQHALLANAASIILIHNHPSGNLKPSNADIQLTGRLKEFGAYIELPILDHLIISTDGYYSFADEGIL